MSNFRKFVCHGRPVKRRTADHDGERRVRLICTVCGRDDVYRQEVLRDFAATLDALPAAEVPQEVPASALANWARLRARS